MEIFAFLFLTAVLMPAFAIAAVGSQPARTGAARMGAVQGQRLAGMPQLP
jgi:hypothetical protein